VKRTDLLSRLGVVAPALADNSLIPALQHFWFLGDQIMAFNDRIAISTPLKTEFKGAVPGKTLIDLLKASQAKEVELIAENNNLLIKAASSKFRLGILPTDSFLFEMPELAKDHQTFPEDFYAAIDSCMRSVSADTSIPDQLGITLIPEDTTLHLFSTNNSTISTAKIKLKAAPKFKRVILSEPFCKQLLNLNEKGGRLEINSEYALFVQGETSLFGRLIESGNPLDFLDIFKHHTPPDYKKRLIAIPTKLQLILERAIIITDTTAADRKPTLISVKERGRMSFGSKSDRGEVFDFMGIEEQHPEVQVRIEPKLIKLGYGAFDKMLVTKSGLMMVKDNKIYLVGTTGA